MGRPSRRQTPNSLPSAMIAWTGMPAPRYARAASSRHPDGDLVLLDVARPDSAYASRIVCPLLRGEVVGHVVDGTAIQLEGLAASGQTRPPRARPPGPPRTPPAAGRHARSGPRRGSRTLPPAAPRTRRHGRGSGAGPTPGSSDRARRAAAGAGSRTARATPGASRTNWSTSSWSGRLDRVRRDVHDPGQHVGHEAATDHRAGAGDRLRLGRELARSGR